MTTRRHLIFALIPEYMALIFLQLFYQSPTFLFNISIITLPLWIILLQHSGILRKGAQLPWIGFAISSTIVLAGETIYRVVTIKRTLCVFSLGLVNTLLAAILLLITIRYLMKFYDNSRVSQNRKNTERILKKLVMFLILASILLFADSLFPVWLVWSLFTLFMAFMSLTCLSIFREQEGNITKKEPAESERECGGVTETHLLPNNKEVLQSMDHRDYIIKEVERYFLEEGSHLNPKITEGIMASKVGTNVSYLSRAFNSRLNMSFKVFLNYYRIKEACFIMLSNPHIPNNEVSAKCGYSVVCTFNNHFKTFTGKTPMEFKREILLSNKYGERRSGCIDDYMLVRVGNEWRKNEK